MEGEIIENIDEKTPAQIGEEIKGHLKPTQQKRMCQFELVPTNRKYYRISILQGKYREK